MWEVDAERGLDSLLEELDEAGRLDDDDIGRSWKDFNSLAVVGA